MLEWEELSVGEKAAIKVLSEDSYLSFLRIFFQLLQGEKWQVNWHHRYLAYHIERVINREATNLVLNVTPGSGKTEMLSIHAPVWATLKVKKSRFLNLSYSDSLTKRNSRRARDLVKSQEFSELWPNEFGINKDDEWQLLDDKGKTKAEVVSRSTQGQVTGSRGGYIGPEFSGWIALDDPDKPDSMFSEPKRKKVHDLLVNTVRSRRGDKSKDHPTPVVVIQQRLHEDDSTAFLMRGGMGLDFEQISIPALINQEYIDSLPEPFRTYCINDVCHTEQIDGYWSFWPSNEDIGDLIALRESHPYTFSSQYMQSPESLEGGIFKSGDFAFYGTPEECAQDSSLLPLPQFEYRFITVDTAQKTKARNDYTVFAEWGYYDSRIYRLNYLRGKMEAPELRQQFESFCRAAWAKNSLENGNLRSINVEDKSSGTGLIQEVSRKLPLMITAVQRNTDKLTRAMDAQPHHAAGKVVLPYGDEHNYEFVSEVVSFKDDDSHKHDDQTDVMIDAIDIAIIKPNVQHSKAGVLLPKRFRR